MIGVDGLARRSSLKRAREDWKKGMDDSLPYVSGGGYRDTTSGLCAVVGEENTWRHGGYYDSAVTALVVGALWMIARDDTWEDESRYG